MLSRLAAPASALQPGGAHRQQSTLISLRSPPPRGRLALARASAPPRVAHAPQGAAPAGPPVQPFDFLVLGSGIAGLTYALRVAEHGRVAVITKEERSDGSTQYAQGGICAVMDALDSVEAHVADTMRAGDWVNKRSAVELVCREGPALVRDLAAKGAAFTLGKGGSFHLTQEGGHSARRIVHAADVTGREIERALLARCAASPNIHFFEHHLATDLVVDEVGGKRQCLGVDALDTQGATPLRFVAPVTLLATGGAGQAFPITTNPLVATGDGIAMAHRAGAPSADLEFVQFHPTAFAASALAPEAAQKLGGRSFLISEAVRGDGGRLLNLDGQRFMAQYDPRLELATRDIVARAIHDQMTIRGDPHVLLDISHLAAADILAHFPNIAAQCEAYGVDITRQPIPVAPAQHYLCGGVQAGLNGETGVVGLYAAGEVACSGLHGANRLASNSLLEGLVFAHRAAAASVVQAETALCLAGTALHYASTHSAPGPLSSLSPGEAAWVAAARSELKATMGASAGIIRTRAGMKAALAKLKGLRAETEALHRAKGLHAPLVELRNLLQVGRSILKAALARRESRGGHFVLDHPPKVKVPAPRLASIPLGAQLSPSTPSIYQPSAGQLGGRSSLLLTQPASPVTKADFWPLASGLRKGSSKKRGSQKAPGLIERVRARDAAVRAQAVQEG